MITCAERISAFLPYRSVPPTVHGAFTLALTLTFFNSPFGLQSPSWTLVLVTGSRHLPMVWPPRGELRGTCVPSLVGSASESLLLCPRVRGRAPAGLLSHLTAGDRALRGDAQALQLDCWSRPQSFVVCATSNMFVNHSELQFPHCKVKMASWSC